MLFMLVLFGSLIALVGIVFVLSRNIEFGEARFDSTSGKVLKDEGTRPSGLVVPAQRIGMNETEKRKTDDD